MVLGFWAQDGAAFAAAHPASGAGTTLSRLFKWLGGGGGSGDGLATGSADQVHRARTVPGHPAGRAPGKGKGELAAESAPRPSNRQGVSGRAGHGFDARTSKRSAAKSGARFDYFDNADGTFTRRVSQAVINYRDASGLWQPIATSLVRSGSGRLTERANSLGVSFAATSPGAEHSLPEASAGRSTVPAVQDAVYNESPGGSALPWSTSAADTDTVVPGGSSGGPLATMTVSPSESVSWSLSGASSVAASVSGSTAEYDGILPDTNLVLQANGDGVKESVILDSAAAPTTWVFPLTLTGLSARTAADGTLELVDGAGTVVATMPKAYAYDAYVNTVSGEHHENWSMRYSLVTVNGSPAVKMSLDPSWLQDPSIQFPVTVDPTIALSTAGQTDTTYVEYPYTGDFSSSTTLKVGTYDGGAHIGQSFIKIPSLPHSNGYHITFAQFVIYDIWASTCGTSTSYSVYPISSSWSVTGSKSWSDRPGTAAAIGTWTGKPSSAVCSNSSLDTSVGQWQYTALSTSYFQNIALGKTVNNGLALFSSGTDSQAWKQFDSSQVYSHSPYVNITYAPNVAPDITHTYPVSGYASPTLTPELQVQGVDKDKWPNSSLTYAFAVYDASGTQVVSSGYHASTNWAVPAGKLKWSASYYWTVSAYDGWSTKTSAAQAFSTTVSQPIIASRLAQNSGHGFDEEVGNFTTSTTDASVGTAGPALKIDRSYNSLDIRTATAFGAGWSSMADMKAVMDDDGSKNVVITDQGGREQRYGYAASGYTPPMGTYATLVTVSGGGYSLTDTSGTTYTFGTSGGTNVWLLSKVTTHSGLAENLTYNTSHQLTRIENMVSQRSLYFTWAVPSGAAHAHVITVTTDDATYEDNSTAAVWTYAYAGDRLASVCPPSESSPSTASTACYAYDYESGSNYPAAALDADPHSYWRLDEPSGSAKAASSVLANEQTDASSYTSVGLGSAASPMAGSTATAATFDGTSSYVRLPQSLVTGQTYLSVSLWFKTSTTGGLLFTEQNAAMGAAPTPSQATASLYVGTDGKLHGGFYTGTIAGISSGARVDNNAWHHAVISAAGSTQTLYLDGTAQGSVSGVIQNLAQSYAYVGAGYSSGAWPSEVAAGYHYFNGSISDVSLYDHQLTATQVSGLHAAGTESAALLTKNTRPSGVTEQSVSYDTAAQRLTSVTDANGGTYTLGEPVVAGSSAVYHSSVLGADPVAYWQLGDEAGATDVADEVNGGDGTFNDVTLGTAGPFTGVDATAPTAAAFNGTDSYAELPQDLASATTASAGLWFKTSQGDGVLLEAQSDTLENGTTATIRTPQLWVGSDGKLYGGFWTTSHSVQLSSSSTVTDGKWHHAVIAAAGTSQVLYLDGVKAASATTTALSLGGASYEYLGAGTDGTGWKGLTDNATDYVDGSIAEVALYPSQLTASQVSSQWSAYKASSGTVATETVDVAGPEQSTTSSTFDLFDGGRALSTTDADGGTTSYGYDTGGFIHTVTDPAGDVTTAGHDARGNVVSRTTCQDRSAAKCSTSYFTYYLNTSSVTDPRNDQLLTSSDGRSASSSDATYRTTFTYDANGNKLTETTPAVAGHTGGLQTKRTYTTSTTGAYVPGTYAPAGLLESETTPGGASTYYEYYDNGDLAVVVAPGGLVTAYTYDGVGRTLTKNVYGDFYAPGGTITTYTYDALGRVLSQTDPGVTDHINGSVVHTRRTAYTYDADGNTLTTSVSDTTGGDPTRTAVNSYNGQGQLEKTTDPAGNVTQYTYDAFGNQVTKTAPGGQHYSFTHDAAGNLLTTTLDNYTGSSADPAQPRAQVMEKRTYLPDGRLSTVTNAISITRTYDYYDNGLTKQVTDKGFEGTTFVDEQDTYDAAGNLTEQVTANGTLTTQRTLDADNRVLKETADPGGADRVTSYTYDADSRALTEDTTDASGDPAQRFTYTYDTDGNKLSESQYVDATTSLTTAWTYDQRGLATSMTDPGQHTTAYTYDEAGHMVQTVAPSVTVTSPVDGSTSTVAPTTLSGYDTFGERTETEDARGNITVTSYDADGRKTATTLPDYTPAGGSTALPATTTWAYDADGNLTAQTDAAGQTTDYAYDQLGDRVSRTNPAIDISGSMTRGTWTSTYNLEGDQLTQTSPYGAVTTHTRDDLGRPQVTWQNVYMSQGVTTKVWTGTTYDDAGNVASISRSEGGANAYTYDAFGQQVTSTDTTGGTTSHTYDLRGDTKSTTLPDGSGQRATYDAAGRKTATADLDTDGTQLRATSATYDADGNLLTATNALGITESFTYDALGHLVTQTEPVSSGHSVVTRYGYDASGDKTAYTSGNGNTTYYTYTPWGLPETKEIPAAGAYTTSADRTTTNVYDSRGNLTTVALPGGVTLTNTYDALGDITAQSGTGADAPTDARTFTYSLDQQLVTASAGAGQETFASNALGQLLSASGQAGTSSFTYNANGSPLTRTDAAGTSTYTYDNDARLATDTDPATGVTRTYTYNSLSQPTTISLGSGNDTRTFGYDALHRLTTDTLDSAAGATVASITYGYDNGDQITSRSTTGFTDAGVSTYAYDLAGRLTSWTDTPAATGVAATTAYTYDDDGNRLTAGTASAVYDARDQLVSDGSNTYGYTARGTLRSSTVTTTGTATSYTFDAYGQQITAGQNAYVYDALGRVTTAGSTALTYSGQDNTVASDGTSTYTHDPSGALTAVATVGTPATLAWTDLHTDLVGQYTPGGTALAGSAAYDPWGSRTSPDTLTGSVGYQSGYTDPASGQVNMHARWYAPGTGTFTSRDTVDNPAVGASVNANPFAYGNADPLNGTDPSGHRWSPWHVVSFVAPYVWEPAVVPLSFWNYYMLGSNSIKGSACSDYPGGCPSPYGYGSTRDRFCDTHAWTSQCGGGGGNPYAYPSYPGGGSRPHGGGGGYSPGGGGNLFTAAARAAAAAARAAARAAALAAAIRQHALAITASIGKSALAVASTAASTAIDPAAEIAVAGVGNVAKNAALAVAAGATTAAACLLYGCKLPRKSLNQNCSEGTGEGWQAPMPLGPGGRATGMMACVTSTSIRPSGTSSVSSSARSKLSGYGAARGYVRNVMRLRPGMNVNACHLVADTLGGSGVDQRNLATCFRGVNTDDTTPGSHGRANMAVLERKVKRAALSGQSVMYVVLPQYRSKTSKVPYRFLLSATGYYAGGVPGLKSRLIIENTYGLSGVNLGDVIK